MAITESELGLIGSGVSIVLGIVAIGLSVLFYMGARKTEKEAASSLSGINRHTDTLGHILGRQIDKLTTHWVAAPKPPPSMLPPELSEAIKSINDNLAKQGAKSGADVEMDTETYIGVLSRFAYWAGQCNVYVQEAARTEWLQQSDAAKGQLATLDASAVDYRRILRAIRHFDYESVRTIQTLESSVRTSKEFTGRLVKALSD